MPPYRCPICHGDGLVFPHVALCGTGKVDCLACQGTGIVWGD